VVVSFVKAGLLTLIESIGVIMGANIGTTITAWLISIVGFKVNISAAALPIIAFGFPMLFAKSNTLKAWGEILIGFALLFLGLAELKNSVPDLRGNPEMLEFLSTYTGMGYISIILFVFIGTLITIIVQSSSASMALTLVMANSGWIPFELAAAMVLGENIGTTITANLAAIVGNVHAKRAARAHFIFNVFGVIWMLFFFRLFLNGISAYMVSSTGYSPYDPLHPETIPVALSIFHTVFNITNTLILVWFAPFIARVVTRLVIPTGDEKFHLEFIGSQLIRTPDISILEARKEINKFAKIIVRISSTVQEFFEGRMGTRTSKSFDRIQRYEEITDRLEVEISQFLSRVAEGNLSVSLSKRIRGLLSIISDLERIGDYYYQIALGIQRKNEARLFFSDQQQKNIKSFFKLVDESIEIMIANLNADDENVDIEAARKKEREINARRSELRREHLRNLEKGNYDIMASVIYGDMFSILERIGDQVLDVSEALVQYKN
jgi:phosphate:Na+ symporter